MATDSLKDAEVIRAGDYRAIMLPAGYLVALPGTWSDWETQEMPDGRVLLAIEEDDYREHVTETLKQIKDGRGRVSDKRYDILRALAEDWEWQQAEMAVDVASTISQL